MTRKRLLLLSGVALVALLVTGLIGVTIVAAQEPTPEAEEGMACRSGFRMGGWGRGGHGGYLDGDWTTFDTIAEALGLTPDEFFTRSHGGMTLEEIAEEQGVELEDVQQAMSDARADTMQQFIEQAVEDGTMTQEQADWMLEGMEQGFFPMGRGFGRMRGGFRFPSPESE